MPNTKIYLDNTHWSEVAIKLGESLPSLRRFLCDALNVDDTACQLALIGVTAPAGQPPVNIELFLLPGPDRTPERLRAVALRLRDTIADSTGLHAAVRITTLDPQTYVALK